jgi:hypothetical protein
MLKQNLTQPHLNSQPPPKYIQNQQAAEKLKGVTPESVTGAVKGGIAAVRASIDAALQSWAKFDADGDGKITIAEAVELLNSKELAEAVTKITGQPHTNRTIDDIKKWFNRAVRLRLRVLTGAGGGGLRLNSSTLHTHTTHFFEQTSPINLKNT